MIKRPIDFCSITFAAASDPIFLSSNVLPVLFLNTPAPLLEEEGDTMLKTVVANLSHPVRLHWPCARPGFTADNYPVDSSQLYLRQWPEQRFDRQKLYLGASFLERFQPPKPAFRIRCLYPARCSASNSIFHVYLGNSTRPLGEYLKRVLRCPIHNLKKRIQ